MGKPVGKPFAQVRAEPEMQDDFLARGRRSLAHAKRSGEFHDLKASLDAMEQRLTQRLQPLRPPGDSDGAGWIC
jgi:hypothetical protein